MDKRRLLNIANAILLQNSIGGIGPTYDPSLEAVLTEATLLGYTHPTPENLTLINDLIVALKATPFWDKMDIIRLYAQNGNTNFGLINLKDPSAFLAEIVGSLTYSVTLGFTAGAGTSYILDNYTPSADAINYGVNDCSFGYYKTGGQSLSVTGGHISDDQTVDYCRLQPRRSTNFAYLKVNNSVLQVPAQSDDGNHLWSAQYDSALTNPVRLYKGTEEISSSNHGGTPALAATSFRNCRAGNDKSAFVFYGANCIDELGDVETAIENYLTALSLL
jgi:hypothetical protein